MEPPRLHRFEMDEQCFVIDTHTCFCFECDRISWDVLAHYPGEPINRIYHLLEGRHPRKELEEVVGELEWLRVTKAILTPQTDEAFLKKATHTGGLKHLTLLLERAAEGDAWTGPALRLLLARSGEEKALTFSLALNYFAGHDWTVQAEMLEEHRRLAGLAGKRILVELDIPFQPLPGASKAAGAYQYRCRIAPSAETDLLEFLRAAAPLAGPKPQTALEALRKQFRLEYARIVVRPGSGDFRDCVRTLHAAGYQDIALDIPGCWASHPDLEPEAVVDSLAANAAYYAEQLLKNNAFKVEPFASLFNAIHTGTPCYRTDESGVERLSVDHAGRIYPSPEFSGISSCSLGRLTDATLDEGQHEPFLTAGALQTPECLRCWARGLCGGGYAVIHHARTGNPRQPDSAWCDAQRRWMCIAVATFNRIASTGINFSHMVSSMQHATRQVSLLSAARMLLQGRFGVRPLREDDAPWLVRWENWNRAAYFVCNESGALMATRYDREMDALHPPDLAQELVLTQRNGAPAGLIKMRPVPERRLAWAWLYLRDDTLYGKPALRHTLKDLLQEVSRAKGIRHILIPVTAAETPLAEALKAVGFVHAGVTREALYQRGNYDDVHLYAYAASAPPK